MNTKEQAEREYRAQWIRDAARDFLIAHKNTMSPAIMTDQNAWDVAESLWEKYVEERK